MNDDSDSIEDQLNAIPTRTLDLMPELADAREYPVHRPNISVFAGFIDEEPVGQLGHVTVSIASLWAQPRRYVDMTPEEARRLASYLKDAADAVDAIVAGS